LVKAGPTIRLAGTVPVLTSVPVSRPGKQNVPEFHFSEVFKINSSLMMHFYEIIPSWKAWLCFNPWLALTRGFSTVSSGVTDGGQGCAPPPLAS